MTVREALEVGRNTLHQNGIPTPFLDASLLLAHAMNTSKETVLAAFPEPVEETALTDYRALLARRLTGIPVSYLRGVKEFYGREFRVDQRVLVPRPDTETLVDAVLELLDRAPGPRKIHDTCTGTGCIAITLKLERPAIDMSASDISAEAGDVFAVNCGRLGVSIPFIQSDLLSSVPGTFDLVTANPPYLTDAEYADMAGMNWPEPREALAAGEKGLDILQRLIKESVESLAPNGYLVCEAAPSQFHELSGLMSDAGFRNILIRHDLADRERVILGRI